MRTTAASVFDETRIKRSLYMLKFVKEHTLRIDRGQVEIREVAKANLRAEWGQFDLEALGEPLIAADRRMAPLLIVEVTDVPTAPRCEPPPHTPARRVRQRETLCDKRFSSTPIRLQHGWAARPYLQILHAPGRRGQCYSEVGTRNPDDARLVGRRLADDRHPLDIGLVEVGIAVR